LTGKVRDLLQNVTKGEGSVLSQNRVTSFMDEPQALNFPLAAASVTATVTTGYYYYYYIRLTAFFQDNLGKPVPES